ncbi:hypothetical protein YC2023_026182 [Brassica napus]
MEGDTAEIDFIITGGYSEDMIPTVGFNMRKVTKESVTIKLWDLGGQPRFHIQPFELHDLLSKTSLNGIPLLVLGNKIDKPGALSKDDLTEEMLSLFLNLNETHKQKKDLDCVKMFFFATGGSIEKSVINFENDEEYSLSVYDILKVWEESTARTATQQGSGKLGKWKINFVSNLKANKSYSDNFKWKRQSSTIQATFHFSMITRRRFI